MQQSRTVAVYIRTASYQQNESPLPERISWVRSELAKLTDDISAGGMLAVYVEDESRLARNPEVLEEFLEHCRAYSVGVCCVGHGMRRWLTAYPVSPAILATIDGESQPDGNR